MADRASLDHLFILVSDLERSKRFYRDVLGLQITVEGDGYVRFQGAGGFSIGP